MALECPALPWPLPKKFGNTDVPRINSAISDRSAVRDTKGPGWTVFRVRRFIAFEEGRLRRKSCRGLSIRPPLRICASHQEKPPRNSLLEDRLVRHSIRNQRSVTACASPGSSAGPESR